MTNTTQTLKRAAGLASVVGVAAGLAAVPAATAAPTAFNTGWQCISPFINSFGTPTGGTKADVLNIPDGQTEGYLDSLAINVSRTSNALTAVKDQPLYLDGAQLSLEFTNVAILKRLWTDTGGITQRFIGVPGWQNNGSGSAWLDSGDTYPASTNIDLRVKPADGKSYWSYQVGSGASAEIHYAPAPVSDTVPFKQLSNLPLPITAPGSVALKSTASLGHGYLANRNNNNFPITSYVTIEGTNTKEKFQTVAVDGSWVVNVSDPTPGSAAWPAGYSNGDETIKSPKRTFAIPSSKWTPTGDGPVEFRIAPPGNASAVPVESKGYDRDGYNRPILIKPFGSVYVRAETRSYASTSDCVNGSIVIKDATIPTTSNAAFIGNSSKDVADPENLTLGDTEFTGFLLGNSFVTNGQKTAVRGVKGRYETTQAVQPTFAKADLPPAPAPTPTPTPAAVPVALKATVLGVKSKKTTVEVTNNTATDNDFTVSAVTKKKYKSGKSKKQLTVAPAQTVKVKAGQTTAVTLNVSKAVRDLLKSKSIDIVVTITPKGGKATTLTVKLTNL